MAQRRYGMQWKRHVTRFVDGVALIGSAGLAGAFMLWLVDRFLMTVAAIVTSATDNPAAAAWIVVTAGAGWGAWALRKEG